MGAHPFARFLAPAHDLSLEWRFPIPPPNVTPEQRRRLRARAHALDPVVMIGQSGLSATVLQEIERALKSHELIKIRVSGVERGGREHMLEALCRATAAEPVQHIGKILVVHRENPELRKPVAEPAREPRRGTPRKGVRTTRTGRR
jgi:RNA-binding protein